MPSNRESVVSANDQELLSLRIDRADTVDDAADVVNPLPGRLNPSGGRRPLDSFRQSRRFKAHPGPPELLKPAKEPRNLPILRHTRDCSQAATPPASLDRVIGQVSHQTTPSPLVAMDFLELLAEVKPEKFPSTAVRHASGIEDEPA
jgi:hypothetical protein